MILVTGGTGLLGSRLLYDLTSHGEKVRAIKRHSSSLDSVRRVFSYYNDSPSELLYRIEWVEADLMDVESLMEAMNNVSHVYHSAAQVSIDDKDNERLMNYNMIGTRNVVNACLTKSIEKLCHVSSTSALGPPDQDGFIRENSLWSKDDFHTVYSNSKYHSELEVWRGIEEGLNTVIVNPSVILGPGFWNKGSSAMFSAIFRGFKFYTQGVTGYISVDDVSKAMITLMNSHYFGDRFILSSENLSYKQVFDMIADTLGKKRPFIEATPFLGEMAFQYEKMKTILGGKSLITKEILISSHHKAYFSNDKFCTPFNLKFRPIDETIRNMGEHFMKDLKAGWLDPKAKNWQKP